MHPRVRFDTAFTNALNLLKAYLPALAPEGQPVLLVRDVLGCFRILINAPYPAATKHDEAEAFIDDFASALGQYAPSAANTVQYLEDESPLNALFQQAEAWTPTGFPKHFKMLDRLVTGREWLLPQLPNAQPRPPRGVFFGLKGGVGRSTALTILAWHFSRLGKKVLVVDLDLESPGLGPMLLPVSSPQEGDTCVPGCSEALEHARTAVQLDPKDWGFWDTLSVAAYRAGDWKTSFDARQEKLKRHPIATEDRLFLAMIHWQLGNQLDARKSYDEAVAETTNEQTTTPRLRSLHLEANQLLGISTSMTQPEGSDSPPEEPQPEK